MQFPDSSPLVTVSNPKDSIWVLELHHGVDNRLTEHFCEAALNPALEYVESAWRTRWRVAYHDAKDKEKPAGRGALIIVSNQKQSKFFSNGFDFPSVLKKPEFIRNSFNPILVRLLSFPIPVIAAINGHAFAAGFVLALACDYCILKAQKAWLSMNEVHFGAPLPWSFVALFQAKARDANVSRKVFLEGHRFTAQEALQIGLVDELVDGETPAIMEAAFKLAEQVAPLPRMGVYGSMKKGMYERVLEACMDNRRLPYPPEEDELFQRSAKHKL